MDRCCPLLRGGHCLAAIEYRVCRDGGGYCVVVRSRCCGVVRTVTGNELHEWETCTLYKRYMIRHG